MAESIEGFRVRELSERNATKTDGYYVICNWCGKECRMCHSRAGATEHATAAGFASVDGAAACKGVV